MFISSDNLLHNISHEVILDNPSKGKTYFLFFFYLGIVKALQMYQQELIKHKVKIFVRRGGPNYQEGLRIMRELGTINLLFVCNDGNIYIFF